MAGPLEGVRVIEVAGVGPVPFAAMLLADMGADVVRLDRADAVVARREPSRDVLLRGRRSLALDLKHPDAPEVVLQLVERADVLLEGFRPGVMERLGVGAEPCCARNPRLVYGRMTGWGQDGPYSRLPGHDVNYIAVAGVLDSLTRRGDVPMPPLNLVGDFGGGSMFLVFGVMCALFEANRSGQGQVVDAAIVDGAAAMMAQFYGAIAEGTWRTEPGTNALDTGSHFYEVYETADGRFVGVGAAEPKFYAELVARLGLTGRIDPLPHQFDEAAWPAMKAHLREIFRTKTRDEWVVVMEGAEACVAPVLSMAEAPDDPHARDRQAFVDVHGVVQPAPAPRLSRTSGSIGRPPAHPGQHSVNVLRDAGFAPDQIDALLDGGAVVQADDLQVSA